MITADNRPSSSPRLPPEIFRQITRHLAANSDLLSVSLASFILRYEAQRILFRHPSKIILKKIHPLYKPYEPPEDKFPAFIDAISSAPDRLGPLVRTYTHRQAHDVHREYLEKLKRALRAMSNLKRLAFLSPRNLPTSILQGCTFQLEAFNWDRRRDAKEILQKFLPTQPSLKHLTFPCHFAFATGENIALADTVCPKLESLTGSRDAIDLFLKSRKVTYLQWDTSESHYLSWLSRGLPATPKSLDDILDDELAQIHYLTYIPSRKHHLPELLEKLQSLVLLEAPVNTFAGKNTVICLSKLSTLRILIMRTISPFDAPQLDIVRDILISCPHLLHVDLEIDTAGDTMVYQRFTQSSLASTPMRGVILTEDAIYYSRSESHSRSDPDSCARTFTAMSAFEGFPRLPSSINLDLIPMDDFVQDFGQRFNPREALQGPQDPQDLPHLFGHSIDHAQNQLGTNPPGHVQGAGHLDSLFDFSDY